MINFYRNKFSVHKENTYISFNYRKHNFDILKNDKVKLVLYLLKKYTTDKYIKFNPAICRMIAKQQI